MYWLELDEKKKIRFHTPRVLIYFIEKKLCLFSLFRFLSTLNYSMPLATNSTAVSKDECREFMSVFPGKIADWLFWEIKNVITIDQE